MKMASSATPRSTSRATMRSAAGTRRLGDVRPACRLGVLHSRAGTVAHARTGAASRKSLRRLAAPRRRTMFETAIAGSLPKPAWLAETEKLWPHGKPRATRSRAPRPTRRCSGSRRRRTPASTSSATASSRASISSTASWSRSTASTSSTRSRWASATTATTRWCRRSSAPLRLTGRVHAAEARLARAHTKRKLKFTLPGPMTIVDTVADRHYGAPRRAHQHGARLRRAAEPGGARAAGRRRRHRPVRRAGVQRLHEGRGRLGRRGARARGAGPRPARPRSTSATATASRPTSTGSRRSARSGGSTSRCSRRSRRAASTRSRSNAIHSHVPPDLMALLDGKDVMVGVIDVASDEIETPEQVAETIGRALQFVPRERLFPCTNCGLAPMRREVAARSSRRSRRAPRWRASVTADDGAAAPAPITAPGRLAATLRGARPRGSLAPARPPALRPAAGDARELDALRASWDDLPPDAHLRDGGRYRRRRHACFVVDGGEVRAVAAPRPLAAGRLQRAARRHRALVRAHRRAEVAAARRGAAARALARLASALRARSRGSWRRTSSASTPPTASAGRRPRARTATASTSWRSCWSAGTDQGRRDARLRGRRPDGLRFTLHEPWTALLLDDARVIHESTPIQPLEAHGYRDTLVLTYRAGGFQQRVVRRSWRLTCRAHRHRCDCLSSSSSASSASEASTTSQPPNTDAMARTA